MHMTESERIAALTADAKQGDEDAFTSLYGIYGRQIFYFCRSLLTSDAAAIEVTRDVFVYAWRNLRALQDGQSFYRWICGNAFYFAKIAMAGLRGTGIAVTEPQEPEEPYDEPSEVPSTEPEIGRSDMELVSELLLSLPDNERICLLLTEYVGMDAQEAASVAGCSARAVRIYTQSAKNALRIGMSAKSAETGEQLSPFIGRLLRTCGKKCNLPEAVTDGIREELSKPEEAFVAPNAPEQNRKKEDSFPTKKQLSVLCVILGIFALGAMGYILYWLLSSPQEPQENTSVPVQTVSQTVSESVSQEISAQVSTPQAVSEWSMPPSVSEPVSEPTEDPSNAEISRGPAALPRTTDNLRMRQKPDTSDPNNIICQIPANTHIDILETVTNPDGSKWYRVRYTKAPGMWYEGYCSADYVETE